MGACAKYSSSDSTDGFNSASSTHFQMSPQFSACCAESLSPSIASPIARAEPTRRGRKYVPPESGIRPILQNAWMKLADFAAITMSHASAMFAPAPAATPLTAQTTGSGRLRSASTSGR